MIRTNRVYDSPAPEDGKRFLVDRLWPRGVRKEALRLDAWLKDVAPSDALRCRFSHDPAKWEGFRQRYFAGLEAKPEAWNPLLKAARESTLTLLFATRDETYNNAVALKSSLEGKL